MPVRALEDLWKHRSSSQFTESTTRTSSEALQNLPPTFVAASVIASPTEMYRYEAETELTIVNLWLRFSESSGHMMIPERNLDPVFSAMYSRVVPWVPLFHTES